MPSGDTTTAKHGGKGSEGEKFQEEQAKLSSTRMNIVVFMSLLIDLLGFTVILPLMPKLLEFYGDKGSVSAYVILHGHILRHSVVSSYL